MTLQPINVVDRVLTEYRSYLRTEFRARDANLRQALEDALDTPLFLAQEPFFQAHRPFKTGRAWAELGLDPKLASALEKRSSSKTAYLHQSEAIAHLLGPKAGPVVVTTGTGSGKTESFLVPVLQNAIEDSIAFPRSGLTAILVYPMNALANDQEERIRDLLESSGHTHVRVARYDRSTPEAERVALRTKPPHILLTNYMMLEYLLIRPADRDALFANHRLRFAVLDEVHTYRGSLGANIALLFRRLLAHLRAARQDWGLDLGNKARRFPTPIPVATSATIKSVDETGRTPEEVRALRDAAVQEFLGKLSGFEGGAFRIIGETLVDLAVPGNTTIAAEPVVMAVPAIGDAAGTRTALARLAGLGDGAGADGPLEGISRQTRLLWMLNAWLARRPMPISQLVERVRAEIPERASAPTEAIRLEIELALAVGSALPDGTPGALRLRTHRMVRGGWRFTRCVKPACGKLHPMGEETCGTCGAAAAPLYLCRSCGTDVLGFSESDAGIDGAPLHVGGGEPGTDWYLYDDARFATEDDDGSDEVDPGPAAKQTQLKGREIRRGSFDPDSLLFSADSNAYPLRVTFAPARNRCLACQGFAGAGSLLTPVSLGTSAAVRVLAEGLAEGLADQHGRDPQGSHDRKERLLIFADSRQDAAHQARFITYAGRFDRMRRRLVRILGDAQDRRLSIDKAIGGLVALGVELRDNVHTLSYAEQAWLPPAVLDRARAWEEAPLLDDLAVSASYRATVFNLGLVGVRYAQLEDYVAQRGASLAARLGITTAQLAYIARCLLDEMRRRTALSRPILRYHPLSPHCPDEFKNAADWERRIKRPQGFACERDGTVATWVDPADIPGGLGSLNLWRKEGRGGSPPVLARRFVHLLSRMGGVSATEGLLKDVVELLAGGPRFIVPVDLFGAQTSRKLLQVNADTVLLELTRADERFRCSICSVRIPWVAPGSPCPSCPGTLQPWPDAEVQDNRHVTRINAARLMPLVAGEHTAQVSGDERRQLETHFKASADESPVNVLACSPTLEMGIDVGGLDAIILRNVPPRPDNYAQRGGRAGRRSRVGIVLGYARSTPHDGYFFDKPGEMIAGEVPAPGVGLGNRDVVLRHLAALAFGAADPGLAGRMVHYVTVQGGLENQNIDELIAAVEAQTDHATKLALDAWGPDILGPAGLADEAAIRAALAQIPARIRNLFARVQYQISKLQETIERWSQGAIGKSSAMAAHALKCRLLGISDERRTGKDADDRSAGNPMRRFAEFGILPGYEFPTEPATLRLLKDDHEEEAVSVARRFGLSQYQPEAIVHARGHRWKVVGLDTSSPWNRQGDLPDWLYRCCQECGLRFDAQAPRCPRCGTDGSAGQGLPAFEYGGFLATRDDTPVLQEEDRYAMAALVQCHPQRDGEVVARWTLPTGWQMTLRQEEMVRWLNEWKPPSSQDFKEGRPLLHQDARGFYLCGSCGRLLTVPTEVTTSKGTRKANKQRGADPFGHATGCARMGLPPQPLALSAHVPSTTLRIEVHVPAELPDDDYLRWGYSLGYALRAGMRHVYMLDGSELEFELEPMWTTHEDGQAVRRGALLFIDAAVGGSGFLDRAASEFHLVASRAIEHLDHAGCETACYRCLKSYNNQRHHAHLNWPQVMPELEQLASAAPPLLESDASSVAPWLEAFAAGVGSPLELAFLERFEAEGLVVDKQVAVSLTEGGPVVSVADFRVSGTKTLIYVDGASFHRGMRLRRDTIIRGRLEAAGYRVVALRANQLQSDLSTLVES